MRNYRALAETSADPWRIIVNYCYPTENALWAIRGEKLGQNRRRSYADRQTLRHTDKQTHRLLRKHNLPIAGGN